MYPHRRNHGAEQKEATDMASAPTIEHTDTRRLPPLITVPMAAEILSCSPRKVQAMCASGELKAKKLGTDWRINSRHLCELFGID